MLIGTITVSRAQPRNRFSPQRLLSFQFASFNSLNDLRKILTDSKSNGRFVNASHQCGQFTKHKIYRQNYFVYTHWSIQVGLLWMVGLVWRNCSRYNIHILQQWAKRFTHGVDLYRDPMKPKKKQKKTLEPRCYGNYPLLELKLIKIMLKATYRNTDSVAPNKMCYITSGDFFAFKPKNKTLSFMERFQYLERQIC